MSAYLYPQPTGSKVGTGTGKPPTSPSPTTPSRWNWLWILLGIIVLGLLIWGLWKWISSRNSNNAPVDSSNTIVIHVSPKTSKSPQYGNGSVLGFTVNGVESGTLNLKRGQTYNFVYEAPCPGGNQQDLLCHPIYFTLSNVGGPSDHSRIPNSPEPFITNTMVTFGPTYPTQFYYQCANHASMGGPINLS